MLSNNSSDKKSKKHIDLQGIITVALLLGLLLLIPSFTSGIINVWVSLLHMLLPLLAFLAFSIFGRYAAIRVIVPVFCFCTLVLLIGGQAGTFLSLFFSGAMLYSGYLLYSCTLRGYGALRSAAFMFALLAICWAVGLLLIKVDGHSAYHFLVVAMQEALVQSIAEYRKSGLLPAETLTILESAKEAMLEVIPLIIPGVIGSGLLLLTWFCGVVGNKILQGLGHPPPWLPFSRWQIADWLIWFFIASVLLLVLPHRGIQALGINSLMLLCLIYSLQGISLLAYFFSVRKVRMPIQILIYVLLISQAIGVLLLTIAGITSTWIDFRKIKKETT